MFLSRAVLLLLPFVASALAQSGSWTDPQTGIPFQSFVDPVHGVRYSITFPASTTGTEFIGEIIAPIANKWVGWSLGGGMNSNLLIVSWPYNGGIVSSARYTTGYTQPLPYPGPTLTTIAASTYVNATHWKYLFRCQNCTSWSGGSLNQADGQTMGWAISLEGVDTPASASSNFEEHDDFGLWGQTTSSAHYSNYADFLDGSVGPTTSTTASATTTSKTSTTTAPVQTFAAYDYIVVGSGVSGMVTADRLSEAGKKVLLLERGGPSMQETGGTDTPPWPTKTSLTRFDIPGLFEAEFAGSNPYWWCNDVLPFAGCLVGGGSAINGQLYWLPTDAEFATSNGWPSGWQSTATYIGKVLARLPSTNTPSTDGKRYLTQTYDVVSRLLGTQGYQAQTINSNINQKDHVYGYPDFYIQQGRRFGPVATYLKTARARANFKLLINTRVHAVVRNGATVTGVRTNDSSINGNGIINLTPNGRVVLAAGVFGTSRILFQSGIGPSDMTSIIAADPVAKTYLPPSSQYINLPVGNNVADNPSVNLVFTHPSVDQYDNWAPIWATPRPADANQYVSSQSGVFAASSPKLAFWRVYGGTDGKTRYVQGTVHPGSCCFTPTYPYNTSAQFTVTIYLSTGLTSRGRIGTDASLRGKVLTNPWLTDPVDTGVMVSAINDLLSTYKQVPNLALISPDNKTSIIDHVNALVGGSNHWVGSTKIGTSSSNSVVDTNTKVWNTNNLFVVDAGIFPGVATGNPTGAILTAAEMAVAKILALSGGP